MQATSTSSIQELAVDYYLLTSLSYFKGVPDVVLMWYRIVTTVLLTVFSRWIFNKSDNTLPFWHLHNMGLGSALAGMWLVTVSHFIIPANFVYNNLANDFYLSSLPATGLYALAYLFLYEPDSINDRDLNQVLAFDFVMWVVLVVDNVFGSIMFDINEFSLIPILLQFTVLITQFGLFYVTRQKFADQYYFSLLFLFMAYLGL